METTFTIRKDELDNEFLESLKRLFKNDRELHITVTSATDFNLTQPESTAEYIARLEKAAQNLEAGRNKVTMTNEQFDDFSLNLLK
ncbi:hypothetical protein [Spirosoma jeollabukense]